MSDLKNSVNPLAWNVPITNNNGTPTDEFMRKWTQQAATNGSIPDISTAAAVSALLDLIGVGEGDVLFRGASEWSVLTPGTSGFVLKQGVSIPEWDSISTVLDELGATEGDILVRGASGWEAIAAGASTDVLTSNGAGAVPSWQTASGGGSSGAFALLPFSASATSESRSTHGTVVNVLENMTLLELTGMLTTVTGATYKMGIAPWDTVNLKILAAPTYSSPITVGTGATNTILNFTSAPVALTPGRYLAMIVRTDGTATTSMTLNDMSAAIYGAGVIVLTSATAYGIANQAPGTGDVWTAEGSGSWALGFYYTTGSIPSGQALSSGNILIGNASGIAAAVAMSGDATISNTGAVTVKSCAAANTAGSVPFIGATGLLAQDNTNLFWDETNKRLGIGTSSPDAPITINTTGGATATPLSGTVLHIAVNGQPRILYDAVGNSLYTARCCAGSIGSPSAVVALTSMFAVSAMGYNGSAYSNGAAVALRTSEDWSPTAQGTQIEFTIVAPGTTIFAKKFIMYGDSTFGYAPLTVATLPTAGTAGRRAFVTDALAPAFGSTVVSGGTVGVPVYDDGTSWKVG